MFKRILALLPVVILAVIAGYNLGLFSFGGYSMTLSHWVAFGLLGVNLCLYFFRFRPAVLATGVILLLATFNFISFYAETTVRSIGIGGVFTPGVQLSMLLLLILYVVVEFDLLVNWYLDLKEEKRR